MLRVMLGQQGSQMVDVTSKLDADTDLICDCQTELDTFQRAFGDVELRLHNYDKFFTNLFLSQLPSIWWNVEVWNSTRRLFQGRIQPPITFDIRNEWVTTKTFSLTKLFWDIAKTQRIVFQTVNTTGMDTVTALSTINAVPPMMLQDFLNLQTINNVAIGADGLSFQPFAGLFSAVDIDPVYTQNEIPIKMFPTYTWTFTTFGNLPAILTNVQRSVAPAFNDLAPDNTIESLLLDMAKYYNAEFYINPENGHLVMKQRQTVLNDVRHNVDQLLLDDTAIEVDDIDQNSTYDYIHLSANFVKPNPMSAIIQAADPGTGFSKYIPGWVYTYTIQGPQIELESDFSDLSQGFTYTDGKEHEAVLTIPIGPIGSLSKRIYRFYGTDANKNGIFKLVAEIPASQTTYTDSFGDNLDQNINLPGEGTPRPGQNVGDVWISYDLSLGQWNVIYGYRGQDNVSVTGRVFELDPQISFSNGSKATLYDFANIFGNEVDLNAVRDRWLPFFLPHRLVRCAFNDQKYAVGDSAVSYRGYFPNDYTVDPRMVIKRAQSHMMREYTDIEMFTI